MKEYIRSVTKTNELILSGAVGEQEIERFASSDWRWAADRNRGFQTRKVKKGDIYQFEFGKNFVPEMSYEHRGLVIGVRKRLLYVLPIFSYEPMKHADAYHPAENAQSKSDLFLLRKEDYSFIKHDSVMKLNDIRTVSVNRILYQQKAGRIDVDSDEYKLIESLVLVKYFPTFARAMEDMKREKEQLEIKCNEQSKSIRDLGEQLGVLQGRVLALESKCREGEECHE